MDLSGISGLVLDVDGVLTRGAVTFDDRDGQQLSFHIQDGAAIKLWQRAGYRVAILSGRENSIVSRRAKDLGISPVCQGQIDKRAAFATIAEDFGVSPSSICYVGDDVLDICVMDHCGLAVAVANAVPTVKRVADMVTRRSGGEGAVAEAIEFVLRKQGKWTPLVQAL